MKYPKLRELKEAIKALIFGPYTSRFPYVTHQPFERFRGKPEYHEEDCMGCAACCQVCPSGALTFQDNKTKRLLTYRMDQCIFCGQCQVNCPTEKGILLSAEFDLATTGKREDLKQTIEKELAACSSCGENILPYDQILWVAKRLGPLTFSNASLVFFYLRNLGLALREKTSTQKELELNRADRIKILCPKCRREAVLKS